MCSKVPQGKKLRVAKYASMNGVAQAVRHYKEKNMKEGSVMDWKKAYEKELRNNAKNAMLGEEVTVTALPVKKRGKPLLR